MAAPKFKKSKVSQKINLKEELGIDFSGKDNLKELVGEAILKRIRERTQSSVSMRFDDSGRGRPGKFKPYSKEYKSSDEFKAFGKSNKVNLTASGDMLELMDIISIQGNTIEIGWDESDENAKAFNHSIGDTVPARPFFGISKKELQSIKSEFGSDIKEAIKEKQDKGSRAFDAFVGALIKEVKGGEEN